LQTGTAPRFASKSALHSAMASVIAAEINPLDSNYNVDYVIVYRFANTGLVPWGRGRLFHSVG
jgi:hypothetical protein